ncbi:MAG: phytoene/squalene synthase family protein [Pseudomonadota bacterium]
MIQRSDIDACKVAIRHGSKSFYAASKLLPRSVRDPVLALYAFCRLADDAVDLVDQKSAAVLRLRDRLDRVYSGNPVDNPADRAFAQMIQDYDMPRALPEALLEGFAWDAMERQYDSLSDVRAYSARVAAAVGAMMTVLMGVRDSDALARACDLGVAMQLTNIARDVGEDAREGRLYLPREWMREAGMDPDAFLANPQPGRPLAQVLHRLLGEAQRLYWRSEAGIAALPLRARPAIFAARHIYAAIGSRVRAQDYDSVTHRAHTGTGRKLWLVGQSVVATGLTVLLPRSAVLYGEPLPETRYLVEAAAQQPRRVGRWPHLDEKFTNVAELFLELEARDQAQRGVPISPEAIRAAG